MNCPKALRLARPIVINLKGVLRKNGFKITSEGTANVPTAFIAEYGSGEPKPGIMQEYEPFPDSAMSLWQRKTCKKPT